MSNAFTQAVETAFLIGNMATTEYRQSATVMAAVAQNVGGIVVGFAEQRTSTDLAAGGEETYTYQFDDPSVITGFKAFDKAYAAEVTANIGVQVWIANTLVFPVGAMSSGGAGQKTFAPLALVNNAANPMGLTIVVPPGTGNTRTEVRVVVKNMHASAAWDDLEFVLYGGTLFNALA